MKEKIDKDIAETISKEELLWGNLIDTLNELKEVEDKQNKLVNKRNKTIKSLYKYGKSATLISEISSLSRQTVHKVVKNS